jgi:hypothetical protein
MPTNRPPLHPTTCQTCGGTMLTRYPDRRPHLCRACREEHNCYLPTEQDIAAACEEIQAGYTDRYGRWHPAWDDEERARRRGETVGPLETRVVDFSALGIVPIPMPQT